MSGVDLDRLKGLEAVLFVADRPLTVAELVAALECAEDQVGDLLEELGQRLAEREAGLVLRNVAGGWRLYTATEAREHVERHLLSGRSGRLSQAALETLAVIAYKQPISRSEVGEVRGVNADGAVRSLAARGLVEEVGRDDGPGQAVLYGTSNQFLERIGLASLDDLPGLTEYLEEDPAPDEPGHDQFKQARERLRKGGEIGAASTARANAERRREQEDEMEELTDQLEEVAQNAVARLRSVVDADADGDGDG